MKVLITGVTGRVGRNVAAALQARGDDVCGLVLPDDPGLAQAQAAGVECLVGDLRGPRGCNSRGGRRRCYHPFGRSHALGRT